MSKVGVMMSENRNDGQMSSHFGKAEWVMVAGAEGEATEFVKNEALNGRGAAQIVIEHGCGDVVLVDIGDGALAHLQAANCHAWAAPGPLTGEEALRQLRAGLLSPVPTSVRGAHKGEGHGCCCSRGRSDEAVSCCQH